MRWLWVVSLVVGCGRFGFDPHGDASGSTGGDATDADGTQLKIYGATEGQMFEIDPVTLQPTRLFSACGNIGGSQLADLAISSTGLTLGPSLADTSLFEIDRTNGNCTVFADLSVRLFGATFVPAGVVGPTETLVGAGDDGMFYTVDSTGHRTAVGPLGVMPSGDLAWTGTTLFLSVRGGATDRLATVNLATGAVTIVGDLTLVDVEGLVWRDGTLLGFTQVGRAIEIDPTTGTPTRNVANGQAWKGASTGP